MATSPNSRSALSTAEGKESTKKDENRDLIDEVNSELSRLRERFSEWGYYNTENFKEGIKPSSFARESLLAEQKKEADYITKWGDLFALQPSAPAIVAEGRRLRELKEDERAITKFKDKCSPISTKVVTKAALSAEETEYYNKWKKNPLSLLDVFNRVGATSDQRAAAIAEGHRLFEAEKQAEIQKVVDEKKALESVFSSPGDEKEAYARVQAHIDEVKNTYDLANPTNRNFVNQWSAIVNSTSKTLSDKQTVKKLWEGLTKTDLANKEKMDVPMARLKKEMNRLEEKKKDYKSSELTYEEKWNLSDWRTMLNNPLYDENVTKIVAEGGKLLDRDKAQKAEEKSKAEREAAEAKTKQEIKEEQHDKMDKLDIVKRYIEKFPVPVSSRKFSVFGGEAITFGEGENKQIKRVPTAVAKAYQVIQNWEKEYKSDPVRAPQIYKEVCDIFAEAANHNHFLRKEATQNFYSMFLPDKKDTLANFFTTTSNQKTPKMSQP